MRKPQEAAAMYEVAPGAFALPAGLLWLSQARVLIAADVHFAYEDVIGGALPLWSTAESAATLGTAARQLGAAEIVLLGDIIHGSFMSEGAAAVIISTLEHLRECVRVTLVAGNHEGRTRGRGVLGETFEAVERDGWLLVHGDRPPPAGTRSILGHLHPSLHMGGGATVPVVLAGRDVIVLPALTPYSPGLDVCSDACMKALAPWNVHRRDLHVVACSNERVFPFGSLGALHQQLRRPRAGAPNRFRRKFLRPDA